MAAARADNVQVWRTSTPEPTRGDGIVWTYTKDVSRYTRLFATPGIFIFQLDNVVQPGLDGEYYCERRKLSHARWYTLKAAV